MAERNQADDPFACFDSEDDDHQQHHAGESVGITGTHDQDAPKLNIPSKHRDPECGVLAFHAGTELALLAHVQNELGDESDEEAADAVLLAVDTFCFERHWMMHIGPDKASILQSFVQQCAESKADAPNQVLKLIELGTYCGYSSIYIASTLQKLKQAFHIYTIEVDPTHVRVAAELIRLAKLDSHITVLTRDLQQERSLVDLLCHESGLQYIDFLFIDHEKTAYLDDLKRLESANLLRKGTYVAADNVVFHRIDAYRQYIQSLAERGVVKTRLVEAELEYSVPDKAQGRKADFDYRDGIELTVYLQDPS